MGKVGKVSLASLYYAQCAAAYVRGVAMNAPWELPSPLLDKSLDELNEGEVEELLAWGKTAGLKLHRFKNTHDSLPRVKRVLGFLRSIEMESLLDVGSGRGAFLWPCLNLFPHLDVLSIDLLPHRADMLNTVRQGGIANLQALEGDICKCLVADKSRDVVTMLEVLEHIPDVLSAVRAGVRIAKKYVVISVPSKPDDNPEHLHLLTKETLKKLFQEAGCQNDVNLHFDGVPGHLIMIAALGG